MDNEFIRNPIILNILGINLQNESFYLSKKIIFLGDSDINISDVKEIKLTAQQQKFYGNWKEKLGLTPETNNFSSQSGIGGDELD